jgi:uncharacterized protein YcfL
MKYLKLYMVVLVLFTIIGCSNETGNVEETDGNQVQEENSPSKEDTFNDERVS